METHLSGILCLNKETGKWQDACLPIEIDRPLIASKIRTDNRATTFGFTPISDWKTTDNVHYKDFHTEFEELRRAFIIQKK